jgi:hypothetical protein
MIQRSEGARLLLEALTVRPFQNLIATHAAQSSVGGPIDLAHTARSDGYEDLIGPKRVPADKGMAV